MLPAAAAGLFTLPTALFEPALRGDFAGVREEHFPPPLPLSLAFPFSLLLFAPLFAAATHSVVVVWLAPALLLALLELGVFAGMGQGGAGEEEEGEEEEE